MNLFFKQNKVFSKKTALLLLGSLYFILTTAYSLWQYELKFLYDGTSLIFEMTNFQTFPFPIQREVFFLLQVIPVLLAKMTVSVKWVVIGYVFNAYLFYFSIFFIIVYFFEDYVMGVVYLLIHFRGDPYNYFMMVEELLLGACMAVLFITYLRHLDLFKRNYVSLSLGVILLFFAFTPIPWE